MKIWIDIEDGSGTKLGGGPIISATRWRSTKRLDRAGVFEFEMPAGDPKAATLAAKRIVRCWGIVDGAKRELGAGIIDSIRTAPGEPSMLVVAGDDLLRELTYRSVGFLDLVGEDERTPDGMLHFDGPSTYTSLANALDDNTGTYSSVALSTDDFLYIGDADQFEHVILNLGASVNAVTARLEGEYWNGSAWTAMQIEDGTAVAGVTLAQDGEIAIERRSDWATTAVNGVTQYWIRLSVNASIASNAVYFVECDVRTQTLATDALAQIIALAPSGWSLDTTNGYAATQGAIYARFAGESVLTALVKIGQALGEHFYAGSGRTVVWTQDDRNASGVRAVRVASATAAEGADELALLVDLEQVAESYDLVTRVYPFGAGQGRTRLTLAASTDAAAAGYTVDRDDNYIERDAAVTAYGQIERYVQWKEIAPISNTSADLEAAANALQAQATEWLERNSAVYSSYRLRVAKLDQAVEPGETIRVVFHEWDDGYHAINIDADLVVLESTTEIDMDGIRTVGLQVATVDRWPDGDQGQIVGQLQQAQVFQAHPQLGPNSYTTHYLLNLDADTAGQSLRFRLGNEVVQVQEVALEFQIVPLVSTVKSAATVTSANGGGATVTSAGESSHEHQVYVNDDDLSGTEYAVYIKPNGGGAGDHWLVADTGGTTYGVSTGVTQSHTHDVVIANHTHNVTPRLNYGVYEASTSVTYVIGDLEYRVNGGSWRALATYASDLGDGWYRLDLTADVSDADTFRPLQVGNTLQVRRKTSGSFGSRAHCQVDALLQVRNVIQSVMYA